MDKKRISIAKDFSPTPGARYISDGPFSGEQFREDFLHGLFDNPADSAPIEIDLDGTSGYGTSFLEEAFGGLARKYGVARCIERLEFVSNEEPFLVDEIRGYINDVKKG